jgi:hypothetical protein
VWHSTAGRLEPLLHVGHEGVEIPEPLEARIHAPEVDVGVLVREDGGESPRAVSARIFQISASRDDAAA